eukprot:m.126643 g.126643  ORF g.126643 m.126643 type:complete len:121 (-) comp13838_c0_seq4:1171-1533(-)
MAQLAMLHEKYREHGFEVIAFPSDTFNQEPLDPEGIRGHFAQYNSQYPVMGKVPVNGSDAPPVWKFLKSKLSGFMGSFIKWNFTKFLCDAEGIPIKRGGPKDAPITLEKDIRKLLGLPKE